MNIAADAQRPSRTRTPWSARPRLVVSAIWGLALMGVALAGMPGRSLDAVLGRLESLQPAGFEPAVLTGMLLFGIPVMMVVAILLSVAVDRG